MEESEEDNVDERNGVPHNSRSNLVLGTPLTGGYAMKEAGEDHKVNEGNDDGAAAQQQRRSPHLRFLSAQRPKDGKISHLMVKRLVGCLRHSKTSLFQRI